MFCWPTFEELQLKIKVTEKSLSELCEGGIKCCATGKKKLNYYVTKLRVR